MKRFKKYISVDVDTEVDVAIKSEHVIDFLNECDSGELHDILSQVNNGGVAIPEGIAVHTLDDQLKYELLVRAFNGMTLFQLEELFSVKAA